MLELIENDWRWPASGNRPRLSEVRYQPADSSKAVNWLMKISLMLPRLSTMLRLEGRPLRRTHSCACCALPPELVSSSDRVALIPKFSPWNSVMGYPNPMPAASDFCEKSDEADTNCSTSE